jgi:beta-galactosidase
VKLGVSWYPEHVEPSRWPVDAGRMRDTGLELVRVAEFAWAVMEPARGRFDWGWLDEAIDVLAAHGLGVILCTPTAATPVWLCEERPEILLVHRDGSRAPWGTRRHGSFSSSAYREESRRITSALAERYGEHLAVVAWQLDNEPGLGDTARCWSAEAEQRFQAWLERRYGTIDSLNEAWGTRFWGQVYPSFAGVQLPRAAPAQHSPSIELAHRRFANEEVTSFIAEQVEIVRAGSPGRDIATNHHLSTLDGDFHAMGGLTGLLTHNCYPQGVSGPLEVAYVHELCRANAGQARRGWVMETQPGPVNWGEINPPVPPGQVRLWTWQAALHGMEAHVWFTWRMARTGGEQYHAALRTHDDEPSAGGREAAEVARELAERADLIARPQPRIALLHSYDDAFAIQIDPHRAGFRLRDLQLAAFSAARRLGYELDVVDAEDDWGAYAIVLAPGLHLHDGGREERLRAAAAGGQLVVLGPRALVRDREHASTARPLPTGLVDALGARVDEAHSRTRADDQTLDGAPAGVWTESLRVEAPDAEVLARYGGPGHLAGAPAAVRRGNLVYAGFSSAEGWLSLLRGLVGGDDLGPELEVFERAGRRVVLDHGRLELRIDA